MATPTFYPYVVSPDLYPAPQILFSQVSGSSYLWPRVAVDSSGNYYLFVIAYNNSTGEGMPYLIKGSFNPTLAKGLLNGTASDSLPIQWGTPIEITGYQGTDLYVKQLLESNGFTLSTAAAIPSQGDAFAISPNGQYEFVAISGGSNTAVNCSYTGGDADSWIPHGAVSGASPAAVWDGYGELLVTHTSSDIYAHFLYCGRADDFTKSIAADAISAVPVSIPDATSGGSPEAGIIAALTNGTIEFLGSIDGGHTWTTDYVANFTLSPGVGPLDSVGSTQLQTPGGWPGQVAATVDGTSIVVMFTTDVNGQTLAATTTSSSLGTSWSAPYVSPLATGSVADPAMATSPAGYVYAVWRENGIGSWRVEQAIFGPDGQPIQDATPLPGSTAYNAEQSVDPTIAVDPFQRPVIAWAGINTSALPQVGLSGAFLSPQNALTSLSAETHELGTWDFKDGNPGTLVSSVNSFITTAQSDLNSYSEHPISSFSDLCLAQNETANQVYPNITHVAFGSGSSPGTVCGNFGPAETDTGSSLTTPTPPPNAAWSPSVALTLGAATANSFLSVETDWALEGMGVPIEYSADPLRSADTTSSFLPSLPSEVNGTINLTASHSVGIGVTPSAFSPGGGYLNISTPGFPTLYANWTSGTTECEGQQVPIDYVESAVPAKYFSNMSLDGGTTHSYSSTSGFPIVFLANLTTDSTFDWKAKYAVTYYASTEEIDCTHTYWTYGVPSHGIPQVGSTTLSGTLSTVLSIVPTPPQVVSYQAHNDLTIGWNSTMPSLGWAALDDLSTQFNNTTTSGSVHQIAWTFAFGATVGDWYTAWATSSSYYGTQAPPTGMSVDEVGYQDSSSFQETSVSCTFQLESNTVEVGQFEVTNVSGGNATAQWNSNTDSTGWVNWYEYGTGLNNTVTAQMAGVNSSDHQWSTAYRYVAELHGLAANSLFWVNGVTALSSGCIRYEDTGSTTISTLHSLTISETDLPYDSISKTGGGAMITWFLPSNITRFSALKSGVLIYYNDSNSSDGAQVPLTNLTPVSSWTPWVYAVNITPDGVNQSYSAQLMLNLTVSDGNGDYTLNLTSQWLRFDYLKDTTGDGLTDAEKTRGWTVPVGNASGGWGIAGNGYDPGNGTWVWADTNAYATNGLVSDFEEKEFQLDPQTIDTAHSHMLDTWNLTFNLGNSGIPTSSNFQIWYENTTYNPFSRGVEYSPGSFENGTPAAYNLTNITPTSSHGIYSGDGSSWAAEALWNTSALWAFSNLSGVLAAGWLRAVEGTWHGVKTLTIWGKLSWGANPLVSSTIHDGIADGSRVNPVSAVGIELSSVFGNASGSLSNGAGYAMEMTTYNGTGTSGPVEYSNYSVQALIDHTDIQNYSVTLPVSQLSQFTTVKFQVIANNSSVLSPMWLSSSTKSFSRTIDLVNYTSTTFAYDGNGLKTYWGQISGKIQTVWTGGKVPTWLWLPDDNSTVNGLPLGLERYTGEQAFDLVVLNSSQSITSSQIPYPWGGEDPNRVVLSPGLNDFLVPREQFLDSPLGQAIFLGKNTSYNSSDPYPALVGTSARGVIAHFDGANWMVDLGAYWQNRAINSGQTGNITPSTETGTSSTSNLQVQVTATTTTLANNTGGVPGVTDLYNSSSVPAALQAIVTLNATNVTTLNLVLAGLLDNTSGLSHGVNGTFQEVTSYAESLNLVPSVLSAIPNAAIGGDGLYGAPVSVPPPPTSSAWGSFWNAVTSVVENPLGAILSLETIVWSATVAAMTYLNHLAHEALAIGGGLIARYAGSLVWIGKVFLLLVQILVTWVLSEIRSLFRPVTNAILDEVTDAEVSLWSAIRTVWGDYNSTQTIAPQDAQRLMDDILGTPMDIALSIGIVVEVAIVLVQVLSLGGAAVASQLFQMLLSSIAITAVTATLSLVPSSALSGVLVANAWYLYNGTGGGTCMFFGVLEDVFRVFESTKLPDDKQLGLRAVAEIQEVAPGYLVLALYPAVMLATTVVSLCLAAAGAIVGGGIGSWLDVIGAAIGSIGFFYGLYVLAVYGSQLKLAEQYNTVLVADIASGASFGAEVYSIAHGV